MKTIESFVTQKYLNQQQSHKQIPAAMYIDWARIGAYEAQRWIACSEEMPGLGESVLCKGDGFTEVLQYSTDGFISKIDVEVIFEVTHWRPLFRE